MAEVSATVVTLNEEENIRDCLETLTWCDEIIIVDSYSDDNTVEIAREYTDKIFNYERTGYSEPAREKALEEASGEWICMIDADERLSDSLIHELKEIIAAEENDVVYAPRMNYILGQWVNCAGWWPDFRPVLHKPDVTNLSTEIHNFISFDSDADIVHLEESVDNAITHYNYAGISDFIGRMNRYTDIEAEQTEFKYSRLLSWPIAEFSNRYILKAGFKMGLTGLFLSIFMAWYRFLTVAKAWQYEQIGSDTEINQKYKANDE